VKTFVVRYQKDVIRGRTIDALDASAARYVQNAAGTVVTFNPPQLKMFWGALKELAKDPEVSADEKREILATMYTTQVQVGR
jgi:hypothetical protein